MQFKAVRYAWPLIVVSLFGAGVLTRETLSSFHPAAPPATAPVPTVVGTRPTSLVQKGDRLVWMGSSSTKIGVWTKTVEFLIRTQHPELGVEFRTMTTGGGTFQTCQEHLDEWLDEARPSLVVLNYGGNDAQTGFHGLKTFRERMKNCVAKLQSRGVRPVLVTPQAADARKSGREAATKRALFAEIMLDYGRELGWPVIDVHAPLAALQRNAQRGESNYTILKDRIHLTSPAYVAWGFFFYDRLDLPKAVSAAMISATGRVVWSTGCDIRDVRSEDGVLSFTRVDHVLPILPPVDLPPRDFVPMESHSAYRLRVVGLERVDHEILCEGKLIGIADGESLRLGVNLNTLLLDSGHEAPWASVATRIWNGQTLDEVGGRSWRFEVRKRPPVETASTAR